MPLHILLILVIGGIAGIAVLLHLLGHSRRFDLSDAGIARTEWLRHWPMDQVAHVYLGTNAALIDTPQGPGLLRPFGADTVGHRLTNMAEAPHGLRLSFADFAAPAITLPLTPETRALWLRVWSESQNG